MIDDVDIFPLSKDWKNVKNLDFPRASTVKLFTAEINSLS
jgi:hypothetical protein